MGGCGGHARVSILCPVEGSTAGIGVCPFPVAIATAFPTAIVFFKIPEEVVRFFGGVPGELGTVGVMLCHEVVSSPQSFNEGDGAQVHWGTINCGAAAVGIVTGIADSDGVGNASGVTQHVRDAESTVGSGGNRVVFIATGDCSSRHPPGSFAFTIPAR